MDFEEIKQTMTKEEFLNDDKLTSYSGCPNEHGLKNENNCFDCDGDCQECWEKAIEKNNVKFKGDKIEEQKVIEALKAVSGYCVGKDCSFCKFGIYGGTDCIISKELTNGCPSYWDIKPIEDIIKPKVTIYKVEHREGQQCYDFTADKELPIGAIVVCDTKHGKSYGRIIATRKDIDDGYKKCWEVK